MKAIICIRGTVGSLTAATSLPCLVRTTVCVFVSLSRQWLWLQTCQTAATASIGLISDWESRTGKQQSCAAGGMNLTDASYLLHTHVKPRSYSSAALFPLPPPAPSDSLFCPWRGQGATSRWRHPQSRPTLSMSLLNPTWQRLCLHFGSLQLKRQQREWRRASGKTMAAVQWVHNDRPWKTFAFPFLQGREWAWNREMCTYTILIKAAQHNQGPVPVLIFAPSPETLVLGTSSQKVGVKNWNLPSTMTVVRSPC